MNLELFLGYSDSLHSDFRFYICDYLSLINSVKSLSVLRYNSALNLINLTVSVLKYLY